MNRRLLINTALTAALALGCVGAYRYLVRLGHTDAFADYKQNSGPGGIHLKDVKLWQYEGGKLVGEAQVDSIDIRQDRQFFDLSHVYNGTYYGDKGTIKFSTDAASWNAAAMAMQVTSGAHLQSKDFDLQVPNFTFDKRKGELTVPGAIKGTLANGDVSARNLRYALDSGNFKAGPISWSGMTRLPIQSQQDPKSKWQFQADEVERKSGKEVWKNAQATDGDIIVKAPTIERDIKTDVITATGDVLYYSSKADMACDKAVVYRNEKRAVFSGNVRMMVKPKDQMVQKMNTGEVAPFQPVVPDEVAKNRPQAEGDQSPDEKAADDEVRSGKTTRKYPIAIKAQQIEYWYEKGKRHAIITGDPTAHQELRLGRYRDVAATKAEYDAEKEWLDLHFDGKDKQVSFKGSTGDDLAADYVGLSTKEGDDDNVKVKGRVKGHFAAPEDVPEGGGEKGGGETGGGSGAGATGGGTGGGTTGG